MRSTTVTVEEMDVLFLDWNGHINASGLYREALRDAMRDHGVEPHELRRLVERAREQGYDLDELAEETDRYDDLATLVDETVHSQND